MSWRATPGSCGMPTPRSGGNTLTRCCASRANVTGRAGAVRHGHGLESASHRAKDSKHETADQQFLWRHTAAVLLLSALVLFGFTDSVRSQPAPVTGPTASQPNATAPAAKTSQAGPRHAAKKRKEITIVFAEHVVLLRETITQNADLTDFRIVTWDQLEQFLRKASQTDRIVPMFYGTNGSFSKYMERAHWLMDLAKELKAPTYYLSFVGPNASRCYDALREPADLKPDLSRRPWESSAWRRASRPPA